jgi:NADPH2:quinone reductase
LKPFGMDHGIDYVRKDLVAEVMRLTDNKGVDLVVDPVGGATLQKSLLSLGYRGRVSSVGDAGREKDKLDISNLRQGNRSLTGVFLGAEIITDRVRNMIQRHIDEAAAGKLKVVIDKTFPLKDAAAAHAYIESRKAFGRVLLIP